jgi:galactokinase
VAGGYSDRVAECTASLATARAVRAVPEATRSLREIDAASLPALERALPPVLFRRVRHVVTENERVDAFCEALRAVDLAAAGAVLRAGMRSLRDDYEVSIPELDQLCALGDAAPGCYGSRLTGAGFGGCTLHLVEPAAADDVAVRLRTGFAARFHREPAVHRMRPAAGASELRLDR